MLIELSLLGGFIKIDLIKRSIQIVTIWVTIIVALKLNMGMQPLRFVYLMFRIYKNYLPTRS